MAATVNETILEETVRHQIGLQRYSNSVVRKIIALLNRVDADLVKKMQDYGGSRSPLTMTRLNSMIDAIREIIKEAYAAVEPEMRKELFALAEYEVEYQTNLLEHAIPVKIDLTKPTVEQLVAVVNSRPFQGAILKEWAQQLEQGAVRRVRDAVRIGFASGETIDQMVRRVVGTKAKAYRDGILEISRRDAEAVVRTAVNHVATSSREELFTNNSDVVKEVVWVSTLDARTTAVCRARDGKKFPVNEGPRPPAHYNCRSTISPVTVSWRDLGLNIDEFPPWKRSSMNGEVPKDLTYGPWLKQQPRAFVEDVLGPTKAKLFLDGNLPIDRFVNDRGRELSLEELRQREFEAFKKAGLS